jgi:hypothetical protein
MNLFSSQVHEKIYFRKWHGNFDAMLYKTLFGLQN